MALKTNYGIRFERLWKEYPRKVAKGAAFKAFEKLNLSDEDVEELVEHVMLRCRVDAKWVEGKYIPHLATFLNQHRWNDEYQRIKRTAPSHRDFQPEPEPFSQPASEATVRAALEEAKRGLLH